MFSGKSKFFMLDTQYQEGNIIIFKYSLNRIYKLIHFIYAKNDKKDYRLLNILMPGSMQKNKILDELVVRELWEKKLIVTDVQNDVFYNVNIEIKEGFSSFMSNSLFKGRIDD